MSQRIHLNPNAPRAPMMGSSYQPDSIGSRSSSASNMGGDDLWSRVQQTSSKVEDIIETYTQVRYLLICVR